MVWRNNDAVSNSVLPSPRGYRWRMENDEWVPVMSTLPPIPDAIIKLVISSVLRRVVQPN